MDDTYNFDGMRLPHLKRLCLMSNLHAGVVGSLLSAAPNLTEVSLWYGSVNDACLNTLSKQARLLECLDLMECDAITVTGVATLAQACSNLHFLRLGASSEEATDSQQQAFAMCFRTLDGLQLSGSYSADRVLIQDSVGSIANQFNASLRYLSLHYLEFSDDDGLRAVAKHCIALQELEILECTGMSADSLVCLVSSLSCLRELVLSECLVVTDAVLVAIATHLPALLLLGLYWSEGYTAAGAEALMQSLHRLQQFNTHNHHPLFTPALLSEWRKGCPQLVISSSNLRTTHFTDCADCV